MILFGLKLAVLKTVKKVDLPVFFALPLFQLP